MALTYVGGTTSSAVGSTGTNLTVSLTSLLGGSASAPAEGDIVIVSYATGSDVDRDLSPVTSGYTRHCDLYSGDNYDTNLWVATKIMGSTPDTSVVLPPSGHVYDAITVSVQVWRASSGNAISIYDIQTATGTNGGRPTPPAITPTRLTSIVISAGAYALSSTTALTSSDLSNFVSVGRNDTNCSTLGMGSFAWTSGTFTPAQFGGGSTSTSASWCAYSLVIAERVANPLLNKDLIAYWKLNSNSKSETGIAYDGTDTDITYTSDYASFNGSSSKVQIPNIGTLPTTGWSISFWVNTSMIPVDTYPNVICLNGATTIHISGFPTVRGQLAVNCRDDDYVSIINQTVGTVVNDGNWHHIFFNYKGGGTQAELYLNGKLVATGTGNTPTSGWNNVTPFFGGQYGANSYWSGLLRNIALWNRALTSEEIQQIFYAGNGNQYPFQTNMADFM